MNQARSARPWEDADDEPDDSEADAGEPSPESRRPVYRGVLRRVIAYVIDLVIVAVVSFVGLTILLALLVGVPESGDTRLSLVAWSGIVLVAAFYFIGFWTGPWRATPGMRALRLQIASARVGESLSFGRAAIRVAALGIAGWPLLAIPALNLIGGMFLLVWPFLLLATTIRDARRRGMHDRLAGSVVIAAGDEA